MRSERDFIARMNYAVEEGLKRGMEKGMKEGMEKGIQEQSISIARAMLADGLPIEQISRLTALPVPEVEKLKSEKKAGTIM